MKKKSLAIVAISFLVLLAAVLGGLLIENAPETHETQSRAGDPAPEVPPGTGIAAEKTSHQPEPVLPSVASTASLPATSLSSPANPELSPSDQAQQKQLAALDAYRHQPDAASIQALVAYLDHDNPIVAAEAINVLGYLAFHTDARDAVLRILLERAADPAYPLRGSALYMAAVVGKDEVLPVVAGYVTLSETDDPEDYDAASRALAAIRSPACLPLIGQLLRQTTEPATRKNCFDTLSSIGTPEAQALLIEEVAAAAEEDQASAAVALARFTDPDSVEFLSESIATSRLSPETIERLATSNTAADIFGRLLTSDYLLDEHKIDLLDTLAAQSVQGNAQLRVDMTALMATLAEQSDSQEVKIRALKVIGELGEEDAPQIIEPYLRTENPAVRKAAFSSFVGYTNPWNYDILFELLWEEDEEMRRTAMTALEPFVLPEDIDALEKAAQHSDEFIRRRAESLLNQLKS
jgi:HEAT repeat protein